MGFTAASLEVAWRRLHGGIFSSPFSFPCIFPSIPHVSLPQILGQARIFYAMASDGLLPPIFARIHPKYQTPYYTTIITGVVASIIAGLFPIDVLGEMVSIGTLFAFGIVCAGVIVLRYKQPGLKRPFRVPLFPYTPILGVLTAFGQMVALPAGSWLRLFLWMLLGCAIYFFYGRHKAIPYAVRRAALLGIRPAEAVGVNRDGGAAEWAAAFAATDSGAKGGAGGGFGDVYGELEVSRSAAGVGESVSASAAADVVVVPSPLAATARSADDVRMQRVAAAMKREGEALR
jgi:hypothetical protein